MHVEDLHHKELLELDPDGGLISGNVSRVTAAQLGIGSATLYRRLKEYGMIRRRAKRRKSKRIVPRR